MIALRISELCETHEHVRLILLLFLLDFFDSDFRTCLCMMFMYACFMDVL